MNRSVLVVALVVLSFSFGFVASHYLIKALWFVLLGFLSSFRNSHLLLLRLIAVPYSCQRL